MVHNDSSNKVIHLAKRRERHNNSVHRLKNNRRNDATRVIAITSGKGGVGKTTTDVNISTGLAKEEKSSTRLVR